MRCLVTGAAGFVGRHLVRYLLAESQHQVFALARSVPADAGADALASPRLEWIQADLMNGEAVSHALNRSRPDQVFHLAASSSPFDSLKDPIATLRNNLESQVNLFQVLLEMGLQPRILVVGSSEEYGRVAPEELPIPETAPLRPQSPYAVSKIAQDMLGYQYFLTWGLEVVRVRPFNHAGPGQSPRFVTSSFARQIAEAELGLREPVIRVGNLEVRRDFTDVRDVVRAYSLSVDQGEPGEVYNIGSGESHSVEEILERLLRHASIPLHVEHEETRARPWNTPELRADVSKFRKRTCWSPSISLDQTLRDTLDYWRSALRSDTEGR